VGVGPEKGCVSPVCLAMTSGTMKSATRSVTMMDGTAGVATVRHGVQVAAVKVNIY